MRPARQQVEVAPPAHLRDRAHLPTRTPELERHAHRPEVLKPLVRVVQHQRTAPAGLAAGRAVAAEGEFRQYRVRPLADASRRPVRQRGRAGVRSRRNSPRRRRPGDSRSNSSRRRRGAASRRRGTRCGGVGWASQSARDGDAHTDGPWNAGQATPRALGRALRAEVHHPTRYTEQLEEAGAATSVGSHGDLLRQRAGGVGDRPL